MSEIKIRELKTRQLSPADIQDALTLETFEAEPEVEVYYHRDPENDEPIANPDGSVSYIARCVNINGVQWQIPAEVKTKIPKSVYEVLQRSEDIKNRYRPQPINITRINLKEYQ